MESIIELIRRNTPEFCEKFIIEKIESENGCDVCEYFSRDGKIVLRGNNCISIAHAYWCYLKKYCAAYFSHCSSFSVEISIDEAPLPDEKFRKVIKQKKRVYLDYITYSNSMWTWGWDEWEKELDMMAMKGINLALNVVGNDAVLFNALVRCGLSDRSAAYFISGPAFYAWQMTGKIDSYLPRNDYENYEKQLSLAKKIYDRMTELDIEPILSTFNGQISEKIIKLFGKVKNYKTAQWQSFPSTKKIDILDERFKILMREYIFFQEERIGKADYYMCDYFCNFEYKTYKEKYITPLAVRYDSIINFCVESKRPCIVFPSDGYNKYFLSGIKNCDTLVIDLDGTMFEKSNHFDSFDCVIGNSHNNSPHASLRGDMKKLAENEYASLSEKHQNVAGVGFFPESIDQNPMYQELMFDIMTSDGEINLNEWLKDYVFRRYKQKSQNIENAYRLLIDTCYSKENSKTDLGSTLCSRPVPQLRHTSPYDTVKAQYNNRVLFKALKMLYEDGIDSMNMKYCLVFVCVCVLDNFANEVYEKIMKFYFDRNGNEIDKQVKTFLEIFDDVDDLLTSFEKTNAKSVFDVLQSISANDEDEKSNTLNYLSSHTIWGPLTFDCRRFDYNWIYLSEFLIKYYATRWAKFFEYLSNNFGKRDVEKRSPLQFDDRDSFSFNPFYKSMAEYEKNVILTFIPENEVSGDTRKIIGNIINKYEGSILNG